MSNGKLQAPAAKDLLQELRSNRRTQGMAVVFLAVLGWTVWQFLPETKKAAPRARSGAASTATAAVLGDQQLRALQNLPDLAKAAGAGELPKSAELSRDLFLFDPPAARQEVWERYVEPPPPPTEEEKAAARLKAERDQESSSRPAGVRFLGYISSPRQGQLGAFMKGEEPLTLPLGDLTFKGWKLVKLDETGAEFQNLKFPDLRHKVQPTDGGSPAAAGTVRNEF